MKQVLRSLSVSRILSVFCLLALWFSQIVPLHATATSWPTQWNLESLENSSSEWWQSLRVQSVPGVLYHLQESNSMAADSWTTLETFYGSGSEWICPLFPGSAPAVAPPPGQPIIPPAPATLIRFAYLVMERTTTGNTLVSWNSLDDHSSKRMVLSGVTLDPVWDEFDAAYFNQHGNHLFALSPRLGTPVNFTASSVTLGTLDAAMIADFTSHFSEITANIANSVANAALYSHQPVTSGARKFYRIAADWSVDSDADGRFDWQEIIFDGNNPFATDSDGDGTPDQAAAGSPGGTSSGYPVPTDAEGPTPLATIQQQTFWAKRIALTGYSADPTVEYSGYASPLGAGVVDQLKNASTYEAFRTVVDGISIPDTEWSNLLLFSSEQSSEHEEGAEYTRETFNHAHSRFRLKLDHPAPPGGYSIPLTLAVYGQTYATSGITTPYGLNGQSSRIEITLTCPEGATEGPPVELPGTYAPSQNQKISFMPGCVTTRDAQNAQLPENGTCVTGNDSFFVDFGNLYAQEIPVSGGLPVFEIFWKTRKLEGDRQLASEWKAIQEPVPGNTLELRPVQGGQRAISGIDCGIYQFKAVLVLPDATQIDFPFVRMRNAKSIKDYFGVANPLLEAGQPDYIGICKESLSKAVRDEAVKWLGDTGYSEGAYVPMLPGDPLNPDTKGSPKCNIFVTHMANQVGAITPYYSRFGRTSKNYWDVHFKVPTAPMAKEDWYINPEEHIDIDIAGWHYLADAGFPVTNQAVADFSSNFHPLHSWQGGPCPGMACASDHTKTSAIHGHVGIMDYDGSWINAGGKTVNKSLHMLDTATHYKPNTFRSR